MAENGKDPRLQKFRAEVQLVVDTYPDFAIWPPNWHEIGDFEYAYRKGQVLVADRDLDRAVRLLDGVEVVDRLPVGVNVLQGRDDDIQRLLEVGDESLGRGVVTPNHILEVCPRAGMCPATEPVVPASADPWPAVASVKEGKGVRVAVVDTGFLQERYDKPWLAGVIADAADIEDPDSWPSPDGFIDPYAGHGTFIAGVIRCIAPGAEVSVEQVVDQAGVVTEADLIRQLDDALAKSPDVISFSAGCYTRRNVPPKGFVEFYANRLRHHKGVVLVAAAGNDATRTPFWPAAFPWAVSVGSLDAGGRDRSEFSNFGGWVDVYAPGEHLVNAYATGQYRSVVEPSLVTDFDGMCEWSGTSFSTPVVAGLIAARMARSGENGQQAAHQLLRAARIQATPGVGPRLWF
jgi:subtilisin family serine protease